MDDPLYSMKREMLRRRMSVKTIKTYLLYVKKFLLKNKAVPIKKLSKKHVRDYLYYLQDKDVSGSTMNVAHNALRFFMIEILHKGMYLKIKFSKMPKKKVECLTGAQVLLLIGVVENPKHRLLVSLMYGAGLRVSEVVKLKKEHLDFDQMTGWVIEGKGKKDRPFIIPSCLEQELRELCKTRSFYLFKGRGGTHLSVRSVQEIVEKAGKKALKKKVHPHMLRHSFTTHLLERGEDITSVQQLLGHAHPKTTLGYSHYAKAKLLTTTSPLDEIDQR